MILLQPPSLHRLWPLSRFITVEMVANYIVLSTNGVYFARYFARGG